MEGEETDMEADVIVVGGGLAGLAGATYLAREGRDVLLYEKAAAMGGRARTQQVNGYSFNLGPHALFKGGQAAEVLRELGVTYQGTQPGASGAYAVDDGRLHTLPAGFVSLLSTGLLRPLEKLEFAGILSRLPQLETSQFNSIALTNWLQEHVKHARLRELVSTFVRVATYSDDPDILSAGAGLKQLQCGQKGVLPGSRLAVSDKSA